MKKKFTYDISVNLVQLLLNQFCGLVIFYVLSVKLGDKNLFGQINWALAVLMTAFNLLSFGIDQLTVKKIAAGANPQSVLSTYIFHVILTGLSFYLLLLVSWLLFPAVFQQRQLLLLVGIGKLMIFFSTPFKQAANGMERFRPLLFMATCSNVLRSIGLILVTLFHQLSLHSIVIIFIAGDIAELLLSIVISSSVLKIPLSISFDQKKYAALVKASLPLLAVVIFTSAMARFDWIFIGLFSGNTVLAEYSFAYKVFEMATLPLLVITPVLIPRFTRLFNNKTIPGHTTTDKLLVLLRMEMVIASFTALVLNIAWIPVIDGVTHGNYGAVNSRTILLLSVCMPFLYFNNFLWTINFAKNRLKLIFRIIAVGFLVNIIADIILIPLYEAEGAAIAYILALAVQSVAFFYHTKMDWLKNAWTGLILCPMAAFAAGFSSSKLVGDPWLVVLLASAVFILVIFLAGQIRTGDRKLVKEVLGV